jgi:transposase
MKPMRVACEITWTDEERQTLTRWSRGQSTPARLVLRAKIVLLSADGRQNKDIALKLATARNTVARWPNRIVQQSLSSLEQDAPRPGRTAKVRDRVALKIVEAATQDRPAHATPWRTRSLTRRSGGSVSMVTRVWKANGLQPHHIKTLRPSNDQQFAMK